MSERDPMRANIEYVEAIIEEEERKDLGEALLKRIKASPERRRDEDRALLNSIFRAREAQDER